MNLVDSVISFFSGLGIRLFLPLALTGIGIWILKRLDQHWQAEAKGDLSVANISPGNPGCWNVMNCSQEARAACKAFAQPETPCWQCKRNSKGQLEENCLDCQVFKNALPVRV